jgi:hypothetical protein
MTVNKKRNKHGSLVPSVSECTMAIEHDDDGSNDDDFFCFSRRTSSKRRRNYFEAPVTFLLLKFLSLQKNRSIVVVQTFAQGERKNH